MLFEVDIPFQRFYIIKKASFDDPQRTFVYTFFGLTTAKWTPNDRNLAMLQELGDWRGHG